MDDLARMPESPRAEQLRAQEGALKLYTVGEVAALLRYSRSSVWGLIDSGALPSVKLGRLRRVSARQLTEFIAGLEKCTADRAGAMPTEAGR